MSADSVTTLLANWRAGDQNAKDRLVSIVYDELHRLAAHFMRRERSDHTLQATALVHEMYLKLFKDEPMEWQSKAHLFAIAGQQLRRILVNHARQRAAEKRGGRRVKLSLSYANGLAQPSEQDLLNLDEALTGLEQLDPRAARVIELRFFVGLTETEIAEALNISLATLKRDWAFGRAWLISQIGH